MPGNPTFALVSCGEFQLVIILLTLLAVLCLDASGEGSIELTQPASLPSMNDGIDVELTGSLRTQKVTISRDPRADQKHRSDQLAFCFHDWCYSLLTWKLKDCPASLTYKLARTLTPESAKWEEVHERRHDLDSSSRLKILASHEPQPLFLSRLPMELRTCIWRYTGLTTPYSAFILVTGETSRLGRYLRSPPSREVIIERGSWLSAKMISVFGTEYIQSLIIDTHFQGRLRDTIGVKYITSLGGICAIQLLGPDWESDWIGKIPNTDRIWHGMIKGNVSSFRYSYNVSQYNAQDIVSSNVKRI